MTSDEFADKLRDLGGEAEDAGLDLPELIAVLPAQDEAMQISSDE